MVVAAKTRRRSGQRPAATMTIPQLRAAFHKLEGETYTILKEKSKANQVEAFQTLWKKIFKKKIGEEAAKEYLAFKEKSQARPQAGGAAPVAWTMGPGTSEPYGNFPSYMGSGLVNYNSINQDSFNAPGIQCNAAPKIPFSIGNNTNPLARGGGGKGKQTRRKQRGGMARLVYGESPPSFAQDLQARAMGQLPSTPSSDPSQHTWTSTSIPVPNFRGAITPSST